MNADFVQKETKTGTVLWPERGPGPLGWQNPILRAREVAVPEPVSLAAYLEHPGPCKGCGSYYGHEGFCKRYDRKLTAREKERLAEREFAGG